MGKSARVFGLVLSSMIALWLNEKIGVSHEAAMVGLIVGGFVYILMTGDA